MSIFNTIIVFILCFNINTIIAQEKHRPFSNTQDVVVTLPKYGSVKQYQVAGVLPIHENKDPYQDSANLFYWFVASDDDVNKDPIILWFNGGPGASGFYGFFAENGPYEVQANGTLQERPFSWSQRANYLIIEQAPGIGLSYADSDFQLANETQAIDMLHYAITQFYKKYPELKNNPLYLAGQSYAGKYIPELATKILEDKSSKINLKGIIIANGWVDPIAQLSVKADFAYSHGLIDLQTKNKLQDMYQKYKKDLLEGKSSAQNINKFCDDVQNIIQESCDLCKTNIRVQVEPDYSPINIYLNQLDVQKTLHVDPRIKENVLFSENVSKALSNDAKNSVVHLYDHLLNNEINVLIISGLDDGSDCNFMATDLWLDTLSWKNAKEFHQAPTVIWRSQDGTQDVAGYVRKADRLTYAKVRGAGHLAPMDQPKNVRDLVYQFIFSNH